MKLKFTDMQQASERGVAGGVSVGGAAAAVGTAAAAGASDGAAQAAVGVQACAPHSIRGSGFTAAAAAAAAAAQSARAASRADREEQLQVRKSLREERRQA